MIIDYRENSIYFSIIIQTDVKKSQFHVVGKLAVEQI